MAEGPDVAMTWGGRDNLYVVAYTLTIQAEVCVGKLAKAVKHGAAALSLVNGRCSLGSSGLWFPLLWMRPWFALLSTFQHESSALARLGFSYSARSHEKFAQESLFHDNFLNRTHRLYFEYPQFCVAEELAVP